MANANVVLGETQVTDLRVAMAQQVAQSEYRMMNVPGDPDYSAHLVEAPFVSSLPVAPKVGLSLGVAMAISFILAAFSAVAFRMLAAEFYRRGKASSLLTVCGILFAPAKDRQDSSPHGR